MVVNYLWKFWTRIIKGKIKFGFLSSPYSKNISRKFKFIKLTFSKYFYWTWEHVLRPVSCSYLCHHWSLFFSFNSGRRTVYIWRTWVWEVRASPRATGESQSAPACDWNSWESAPSSLWRRAHRGSHRYVGTLLICFLLSVVANEKK